MKNLKRLMMSALLGAALSGCTSVVGGNMIDDEGNLQSDTLSWPDINDASQEGGTFPTQNEINMLQKGLTRLQLKKIIEHPHFQERFRAREWNYLFNFNMSDGTIKQCQLKILFDKNKIAQNYYWKPADCLAEKVHLSADALFIFDRGGVEDIKPAGKAELNRFAQYLINEGNQLKVKLVGHTDYLGSDSYNQNLSDQRASSVRQYLASQGVNPDNLTAEGRGENQPIKKCPKGLSKQALINCLAPNRRVDVEIAGKTSGAKFVWRDINMKYSVMGNQ